MKLEEVKGLATRLARPQGSLLFPLPGDGLQGQQHPSWLNPCPAFRVTLAELFALYQLHFNTGLQMQVHTFVARSARRGLPSHQSRTSLTYRSESARGHAVGNEEAVQETKDAV